MTDARNDEPAREMIHASAMILGESGVLLRGPSGSGKSSLVLDLIDYAETRGAFARLVGDDRLELVARNGRLIARPHPAIAGAIEARGLGVIDAPFEPAGVIHLAVDLFDASSPLPRYPAEGSLRTRICGVELPRLPVEGCDPSAARKIFSFFHGVAVK
jgi:serine kinase of HPr protein (carbohydrate metabolism regulator)